MCAKLVKIVGDLTQKICNFAAIMKNWLKRYAKFPFFLIVGFIIYMGVFNDNSLVSGIDYSAQIRDLEAQIEACEDTLRYYQALNDRLDTDPVELERIVREHYHMQRPSEDVYVFD
jgi:hypothetical protein